MSGILLPHPPATNEQKRLAVQQWRDAAAQERFRAANGLCCGDTSTALRNAALYEQTANGIQAEIDAAIAKGAA